MAYILGQFNKNKNTSSSSYMTLIENGTVVRRKTKEDSGVEGVSDIFENECIQIAEPFSSTKNYYFHGKIKRMTSSAQTFYIKLVSSGTTGQEDTEQYIKTIVVANGDQNQWVDVEFCFTPFDSIFDTIMFELQRTVDDYRKEVRYPIIIYEELSVINNIIPIVIRSGIELIKIGVQSRPSLLMCINGEEIRTSRTGIYELKNGIMTVSFFSVVAGASENDQTMENTMEAINVAWAAAELIEDVEKREAAKAAIGCRCFFGSAKTRVIDSFTLDYMYSEG